MTWFQKPPLGTPLDWGNPLNDGTVLALAMNEGHGDKVQDLSLNGNHGTLNNFAFPPTVASGWNPIQTGIGLNFDGTNDCINRVTLSEMSKNRAHTVSLMVRATSDDTVNGRIIIANTSSGADRVGMLFRDGEIRCGIYDGVAYTYKKSGAISLDKWYNVVYTFDTIVLNLYIDGIIQTGTNIPYLTSGNQFKIGCAVDGTQRFFRGSIDQPRIQSRVWTAKEIRDYAINPWQVYLDE